MRHLILSCFGWCALTVLGFAQAPPPAAPQGGTAGVYAVTVTASPGKGLAATLDLAEGTVEPVPGTPMAGYPLVPVLALTAASPLMSERPTRPEKAS